MAKNKTIVVQGTEIGVFTEHNAGEFISLTDMAKSQMQEAVIIKWLSLKSTIEYLGEWEAQYNPNFNYTEFGTIKIRDEATIEQLVVLSNLESINAVLVHQGLPQHQRLAQLNTIAITQMTSLVAYPMIKKLK